MLWESLSHAAISAQTLRMLVISLELATLTKLRSMVDRGREPFSRFYD